ncbi:MAG: C1 family peptidase [Bdellovibrionota bacterium]|nr:C1 family peptidase [Bdellovibrionota bacterium]
MKWIVFVIFCSSAFAKTYHPKVKSSQAHTEVEEIVTNSIFEELIRITKDLKVPKELVEVEKKSSLNEGRRGKQLIEEMKRKNRERLAKKRGINPDEVSSGKDLVKKVKADNKKLVAEIQKEIKNAEQWQELAESEIAELKKRVIGDWKKKYEARIKAWEAKKKEFNKQKDKYEDTTFDLPLVLPTDKKDLEKEVAVKIDRDYFVVSQAMGVPIRDQKFRPTCSAFAGVRLLEVLMAQNGDQQNLSEQYFYWASKDECQDKPCRNKGSWVGNGLKYSSLQSKADIPLEKDCPYVKFSQAGNETQIPLKNGCQSGVVKVGEYKYHNTLDEVIEVLNSNRIVTASMKLTPNFYRNSPLILYKNRNEGSKMDAHAQGHAMNIVGYVKLPQVLNEGKVCFIVANSWGEGWGEGGYSCLSEKWMLNQRQANPFVSVSYLAKN